MFELLFKVNAKVSRDFQLYADAHGKFFYFVEIKIKTYNKKMFKKILN